MGVCNLAIMALCESAKAGSIPVHPTKKKLSLNMVNSKNCLFCFKSLYNKDYRAKFCNRSCVASFNNSLKPKRLSNKNILCISCNCFVSLKKKKDGGYYNRKFCDQCLKNDQRSKLAKRVGYSVEDCNLENQTKSFLYKRRKNWQSANSTIRKHAREVFEKFGLSKKCKICEYDKHIEICHIKQVKDFSDNSKIVDINSVDNLICLCPNHHWEYDNGLIYIVE